MDFEIAIFNGYCDDGNKIMNSVKTAYLYADKVRVYDFYKPQGYENEKKADYNEEENRRIRKIYTSDGRLNEEVVSAVLDRCSDEELERLLRDLDNRVDYLTIKQEIEQIIIARELSSNQYISERFHRTLARMGIEYIEPVIFTKKSVPDLKRSFDYIQKIYVDDKGFKVLNDTSLFNKSVIPSMWTPTYLADYTIASLPGFEEATVDEIIDIRKELDKYIIPYRSAILRMAKSIKETPDSESLYRECEYLYHQEVEDKVAAINAAVRDNNVFMNIAKSLTTEKEAWVCIGALFFAFATSADIVSAVSMGTAITTGGISVSKGVLNTLDKKKKIEGNEMFLVYETGKKLRELGKN